MSILNRASNGHLSVLLALCKTWKAFHPLSEGELVGLCGPASLPKKDKKNLDSLPDKDKDKDKDKKDSEHVRNTLRTWTRAGLFRVEDNCIVLDESAANATHDGSDLTELQRVLFQCSLNPRNNQRAADETEGVTTDFTFAASWILSLDVLERTIGKYREIEELQLLQFAGSTPPFSNDTRWVGFCDWARFFGLVWSAKTERELVVDPAMAIERCLPGVFGKSRELTHADFRLSLAEAIPIIEGGRYWAALQERLAPRFRRIAFERVPQSLTRALLTLEAAGTLRLLDRSDASRVGLIGRGGQTFRDVTHIEWRTRA